MKNSDTSYTLPREGDKPAQKITVPDGKDISWDIIEHVYDDGVEMTASYTLVTKTDAVAGVEGRDKVD